LNRLVISRPGAGVIGVVFPASHDQGVLCRRILEGHARDEGIPSGEDVVISLVTSELLTNAIDHGGGGGAHTFQELESDVRVRSKLTVSSAGWILEVSDRGGGDPEELRPIIERDEMPDIEDERGRGFFLLRESVDSLTVESNPEGDGLTFKAERRYEASKES
jgi:anti-sigma regulatory factor (Ser/Thr protein kinase)